MTCLALSNDDLVGCLLETLSNPFVDIVLLLMASVLEDVLLPLLCSFHGFLELRISSSTWHSGLDNAMVDSLAITHSLLSSITTPLHKVQMLRPRIRVIPSWISS